MSLEECETNDLTDCLSMEGAGISCLNPEIETEMETTRTEMETTTPGPHRGISNFDMQAPVIILQLVL